MQTRNPYLTSLLGLSLLLSISQSASFAQSENVDLKPPIPVQPVPAASPDGQTPATASDQPPAETVGLPKSRQESAPPKSQAGYSRPQAESQPGASGDAKPILRGTAEASSVNGHARLLATTPLTYHRDRSVHFIELNIKNISDQVVVVDANLAEVNVGGQIIRPCDNKELEKDAASTLSTGGKLAVAGVGLATLGLAGDIFYEFITPGQNRKRDLSRALGKDGTRHEVEVENFGKRVLMPGDETQGWLGFDAAAVPSVTSIKVPISYMPPSLPGAVLTVPIEAVERH